jgi:hypothetical protein
LQVGISQVGNFAGWNFAGWGFCRLEFCRLPGILQVDDANLKLHHYKAAGTKRRLQVGNFAGWNFAGWEFCRLEFCRLGILQVGILQVARNFAG